MTPTPPPSTNPLAEHPAEPATPSDVVASIVAVPVAGGTVTVETRAVFDPSGEPVGDQRGSTAAWLRSIDPQWLREQTTRRLVGLGSDQFAAVLDVLADHLESGGHG